MSDPPLPHPVFRWLLAAQLFASLCIPGCSGASGSADPPVSRPLMPPLGVAEGTADAGLAQALPSPPSGQSQWFVDSPDSGLFGPAQPVLSSLTSNTAVDASLDRSYLLPLGDSSTNSKAMATKYANLSAATCRAEIRRRRVAVTTSRTAAAGIITPMRLAGSLRNVRFITPGPKSVYGLLDCRMVLLLDELTSVLEPLGVSSVYVNNFYRPKAHLPGKKVPSQHALGLAADIYGFGTKDGRTLVVERDFGGQLGAPVCGETALVQPESRNSVDLRNIVCAMARAKAFHYLLTPNHDQAHANHVHGDIKRGGREHVIR